MNGLGLHSRAPPRFMFMSYKDRDKLKVERDPFIDLSFWSCRVFNFL
jgi:hypothetical protein